MSITSII